LDGIAIPAHERHLLAARIDPIAAATALRLRIGCQGSTQHQCRYGHRNEFLYSRSPAMSPDRA
jgi:hypothetical protein